MRLVVNSEGRLDIEGQIISENTTNKLIKSLSNVRDTSYDADKHFNLLLENTKLLIEYRRINLKLKVDKASILTRWYWKRKLDKIDIDLNAFNN